MRLKHYLREESYIYGRMLDAIDFSKVDEFEGKKVEIIYPDDIDVLGSFEVDGVDPITGQQDRTVITNVELSTALLRDDLKLSDVVKIYSIHTQNGEALIRCSKDSFK